LTSRDFILEITCAPQLEDEVQSRLFLTRSTGNKWRRYDLWKTPPRRLAFVGDSICAFNPFYAQGISSAASSALLLRGHLEGATQVVLN